MRLMSRETRRRTHRRETASQHGNRRALERLTETERATVEARIALAWSRFGPESLAVVCYESASHRQTGHFGGANDSNGTLLVAIVRGGETHSVFFRREGQEFSPAQFGVKKVRWLGVDKRATGPKARRGRSRRGRF